jgi:protein-S-isoprenylcysteine O-methyltransferase Ste14
VSLVRTVLYSLVVPVPVTVLVPWWLLTLPEARLWDGPWRWLGLAPILLGAALYCWCAWSFAGHGGGTPNPAEPPRRLVAVGPYRWVRNPMYVACMTILVGECVVTGAPWLLKWLLGSLLVVEALVRLWEEPGMRRRYGAEYADYCARVGRWLPRFGG